MDDPIQTKTRELATEIARSMDDAIRLAFTARGWPCTVEYVRDHIQRRDHDWNVIDLFHDGALFLTLTFEFDDSDPTVRRMAVHAIHHNQEIDHDADDATDQR